MDPHARCVVGVEDEAGASLGQATPLDVIANNHRTRHKSAPTEPSLGARSGPNLVEIAHARHYGLVDRSVDGHGGSGDDDARKGA